VAAQINQNQHNEPQSAAHLISRLPFVLHIS